MNQKPLALQTGDAVAKALDLPLPDHPLASPIVAAENRQRVVFPEHEPISPQERCRTTQ
jgi:hypothetical protein